MLVYKLKMEVESLSLLKMQWKFLNSFVFILIEVTLLPGLLKNGSEMSIFLHSLFSISPSGLFSLSEVYQRDVNRASPVQIWGERRITLTTCTYHHNLKSPIGEFWQFLPWDFQRFLPPTVHRVPLLTVPCGNTAGCVMLPKPSLLTSQHLSLNGWRRQRLHAGCTTPCSLPFWLGRWSRTRGSAVEKWQGLQRFPHGWQQWTQARGDQGVQERERDRLGQRSSQKNEVWREISLKRGLASPASSGELSCATWARVKPPHRAL